MKVGLLLQQQMGNKMTEAEKYYHEVAAKIK
ncbi:MAG: hypothetical protein JWR05_3081 [Mucilaginibacter sp.]|nr:hypothetical protein [Mucilaginibacter sp.]